MRKLFVNMCRVKPQACLDLIIAAFSELPQPISKGEASVIHSPHNVRATEPLMFVHHVREQKFIGPSA